MTKENESENVGEIMEQADAILVDIPNLSNKRDTMPQMDPSLVMVALEKGLPIEMIEKMIQLEYTQEDRQAKKSFNMALSNFQSSLPVIEKKGLASFPTKNGGKMSYEFVRLEDISKAIKPHLQPNGLSYRFEGGQNGAQIQITCIVSHSDGHEVRASMTASADATGNKNAVQQIASTRSYLKRYTLIEAMGIIVGGEDDDVESLTGNVVIDKTVSPGVPNYSDADFNKNLPNWLKVIKEGTKTADEIINKLNEKGVFFSPEQLQAFGAQA